MAAIEIDLIGDKKARRKLRRLKVSSKKKISRNSMSAAGGVIKNQMKLSSPKETGLLRRSWRVSKVFLTADRLAVRIRPKYNLRRLVRRTKKGTLQVVGAKRQEQVLKSGDRSHFRRPYHYAHLTHMRGKHKGWATRAFNSSERAATEKFKSKFREGITREAAKS